MLIEDIQIGICAMQSQIWQLQERLRDAPDQGISNAIERDFLKRRLDAWKHWILRIPIQQTDNIDFSQEQRLVMRYYYGVEDHSDPGWQVIVFNRPKNLIFDTLILYHLLSMHLFADVRTLTQLARDKQPVDPTSALGEMYLKAKDRREVAIRTWVESAAVRTALTHASDILVLYDNVSGLDNNHVDPIVFAALSTSALIIWAYCMHGGKGCPNCVIDEQLNPFPDKPIVELTEWSGPKISQLLKKDRDTWIEMGLCRGALAGIPLCRCNIDLLMAKFHGCIRPGWSVANTVAPGVFKLSF